MKTERFPLTISHRGVSAKIRTFKREIKGIPYSTFIVEYFHLGKRKREWKADLSEAKETALAACRKIGDGAQLTLELSDRDRLIYLRATEALAAVNIPLDVAATDYAAAVGMLGAGVTLREAAQCFLMDRRAAVLEKRTVREVANEMLKDH